MGGALPQQPQRGWSGAGLPAAAEELPVCGLQSPGAAAAAALQSLSRVGNMPPRVPRWMLGNGKRYIERCGRAGATNTSKHAAHAVLPPPAVNSHPTEEMRRVLGEKIGLSEGQVSVRCCVSCVLCLYVCMCAEACTCVWAGDTGAGAGMQTLHV